MRLLEAGNDITIYIHADMSHKERAISRIQPIALRATALRAALDPGDPCGPWEQESGQATATACPGRARAHQDQPRPTTEVSTV